MYNNFASAYSSTDPAPLTMVETTVRLRPVASWRKVHRDRWYSSRAPSWLKAALRPIWPEDEPISWEAQVVHDNKQPVMINGVKR